MHWIQDNEFINNKKYLCSDYASIERFVTIVRTR